MIFACLFMNSHEDLPLPPFQGHIGVSNVQV